MGIRQSDMSDLAKSFNHLWERKRVRIENMSYPDPILRMRKQQISANKTQILKDLQSDVKILQDRLDVENEKLNRKKLNY